MAGFRIGTCSWKFPSWHGLVYSAPRGISYLAEYAPCYDTVEVDHRMRHLILDRDCVVIRLLGPDRKGIEAETGKTWDHRVRSLDDEMSAIADVVTDLLAHDVDVVVNVNNYYEGSAPLMIGRFCALLDGAPC